MGLGRNIFQKYKFIFNFSEKVLKVFPYKLRKNIFVHIQNIKGKKGIFLRYIFIKSLIPECGDNVVIFPGVYFNHIENLKIGSNVSIHEMSYIDGEGGIEIEDNVSIAHRVSILSSNHRYDRSDIPIKYQGMKLDKTIIKQNVWIGCSCTILAGTTINENCVIGANSTVTKDIESNSLAVGVPAKIIKKLNYK